MNKRAKGESAAPVRIETAYLLELSVGASHVSSMLSPESRHACIEEMRANFLARHGSAHLEHFLLALAKRLDERSNAEGAAAVRHYATHGVAPQPANASALTFARKKRTG
ncbi:hypothetical protein [Paraburkholderia sp. HD33-4]|uniref:hypothetical protein n=1 Tax=Paraburkholderia sp. HD33-4 TaxID=2883242 RepID=UPI001F487A32|nr:hypothetical protein [Paraburkholderia sp. HD33-4]